MPTYARPLEPRTLLLMADHVGDAITSMVHGHERFTVESDVLAGRASLQSPRGLIEFLVGRAGGLPWKSADIQPSDYLDDWTVDEPEVERLRRRLTEIDKRLAHLSLDRADIPNKPPETWTDTIERLLRLLDRFATEAESAPGADRIQQAICRSREIRDESLRRRSERRHSE